MMSSLKGPGRQAQRRFGFQASFGPRFPSVNTISIDFNNQPLSSAKSNIDIVNEWVIGEGLKLGAT